MTSSMSRPSPAAPLPLLMNPLMLFCPLLRVLMSSELGHLKLAADPHVAVMDTKGLTKTAIRGGGEGGVGDGSRVRRSVMKKKGERKANWTYSAPPNASSSSCLDASWLCYIINSVHDPRPPRPPRPLPAVPTPPTCPTHLFPTPRLSSSRLFPSVTALLPENGH